MKTFLSVLALMLGLAGTHSASAQQQTFHIDPSSSAVAFALTGTGHEVHGTFHVQSGEIQFDHAKPALSGQVVVSAASGDSGDKGRDKKMHSDVLDVDHYADVTFKPEKYDGTLAASGDSTIQVSGTFTLHGAPHEIIVPMQVHIDGSNMNAKGSFVVPYVKWGLKDPSVFILKVAKDVRIDLDLKGSLAPAM